MIRSVNLAAATGTPQRVALNGCLDSPTVRDGKGQDSFLEAAETESCGTCPDRNASAQPAKGFLCSIAETRD
jgi:hypothetical protein